MLKSELYYLQKWTSVEQLKKAINEYIHYYNHERIKLKLKGLSTNLSNKWGSVHSLGFFYACYLCKLKLCKR
ncbi:MAG TPA: IS3 family transposase, partial [Thiopseudomonas sp.]|nr:IS3 family transposase [Thiopseudomonas sp.]